MKTPLIIALALSFLSQSAFAARDQRATPGAAEQGTYRCTLASGSDGNFNLVVYTQDNVSVKGIYWMPSSEENTNTAVDQSTKGLGGRIEFNLLGHKGNGMVLSLPSGAASLPREMDVFSYDKGDSILGFSQQSFECKLVSQLMPY